MVVVAENPNVRSLARGLGRTTPEGDDSLNHRSIRHRRTQAHKPGETNTHTRTKHAKQHSPPAAQLPVRCCRPGSALQPARRLAGAASQWLTPSRGVFVVARRTQPASAAAAPCHGWRHRGCREPPRRPAAPNPTSKTRKLRRRPCRLQSSPLRASNKRDVRRWHGRRRSLRKHGPCCYRL